MENPEAQYAELNFLVFTHGIEYLQEKLENDGDMPEEQREAYHGTIESWEQKRKEYYALLSEDEKLNLWLQYGISL